MITAALKCRQRKKQWLSELNAKVEHLQQENNALKSALVTAREENARLSSLCGSSAIGNGVVAHGSPTSNGISLGPAAPTPVSVNINVKGGGPTPVATKGGYGY